MNQDQTNLAILTILLTEAQLAERWGQSVAAIKQKRLKHPDKVPTFFKLTGSGIRYPLEAVIEFESSRIKNLSV